MSDPVQHVRQFQNKIVVHSRNNPLLRVIFSSSLKGLTSDWFYSRSPHSLHNFEEVTKAFLTQYVSHWEAKKNNHHILTVKMRWGDNL